MDIDKLKKFEKLPPDVKRQLALYMAKWKDKKVGVDGHSKLWDKVRKGIDYFRQHNAEAYMVLLD